MEESFSVLHLLMVLFFVLVDVLEPVRSPHAGLKVPFIFPLLGVSGRAMKTLAAGMCGKFQICFRRKNWQIIFFDGNIYRERHIKETDS